MCQTLNKKVNKAEIRRRERPQCANAYDENCCKDSQKGSYEHIPVTRTLVKYFSNCSLLPESQGHLVRCTRTPACHTVSTNELASTPGIAPVINVPLFQNKVCVCFPFSFKSFLSPQPLWTCPWSPYLASPGPANPLCKPPKHSIINSLSLEDLPLSAL